MTLEQQQRGERWEEEGWTQCDVWLHVTEEDRVGVDTVWCMSECDRIGEGWGRYWVAEAECDR